MIIANPTIRKLTGILLCGFTPLLMSAQTPTGEIATWKNDARGAYTLIHDDYGDSGVDGIWQYADTICSNRGVTFTFGAIANSCESSRSINCLLYTSPSPRD